MYLRLIFTKSTSQLFSLNSCVLDISTNSAKSFSLSGCLAHVSANVKLVVPNLVKISLLKKQNNGFDACANKGVFPGKSMKHRKQITFFQQLFAQVKKIVCVTEERVFDNNTTASSHFFLEF